MKQNFSLNQIQEREQLTDFAKYLKVQIRLFYLSIFI